MRDHLDQRGYSHADLKELRDLAIRVANADFRAIASQPRIFQMPSPPFGIAPELLDGFTALHLAVTEGQDLTYFQSKKRLNADFHDHLLSDWGIHHFHLGAGPDSADSRFVSRTGPLLFGFVTDSHFLAIGIDGHAQWADPDLLERLHRYFPSAIADCRVSGPLQGALTTKEEIASFRKAGVNGVVTLPDGTHYRAKGGRTTNGAPIYAVTAANRLVANVRRIQRHVNAQLPTMRVKVAEERGVHPEGLVFEVVMVRMGESRTAGFWLDEVTTGYSFLLQEAPGV